MSTSGWNPSTTIRSARRRNLLRLALSIAVLTTGLHGRALAIDVTLTVDNAYRVAYGPVTGPTAGTLLPSVGSCAAADIFACNSLEIWQGLHPASTDYIYVTAWSDGHTLTGFIGQVAGSGTVVTGNTGWEVYATAIPISTTCGPSNTPSLATIQAEIAKANSMAGGPGSSVGWVGPSGGQPGTVGVLAVGDPNDGTGTHFPQLCLERISSSARLIWYNPNPAVYTDPFAGNSVPGEFLIFRLPVSLVPDIGSYMLQTGVNGPPGTVVRSNNGPSYPSGTVVQLTAVPASGDFFTSWSGAFVGAQNPISVTMDANKTINATFAPGRTLTANVSPPEGGSIQTSPSQPTYIDGAYVGLTAVPAPGWTLSSWSGTNDNLSNPTSVTISGNKTVTAVFINEPGRTLTLTVDHPAEGSINADPSAIKYPDGQTVTLTASPVEKFLAWTGAISSTSNPVSIVMDADKAVTGTFLVSRYLNTSISPDDAGSVVRDPDLPVYPLGSMVQLTAVPGPHTQSFLYWFDQDNAIQITNPTIDVTMNQDRTFMAVFTAPIVDVPLSPGGARTSLDGLSPQPVRNGGTLRFSLSHECLVRLSLRDLSGRLVQVLVDGTLASGPHSQSWDGRDGRGRLVPSGVYFLRLEVEGQSIAKRMVVLR